jgi:hypothetical protein
VILVLSAYDPVVWRVGYTSLSRIARVLASGYHTQAVIGISRDTPLRIISYEQTRGCETFHAYGPQTAAQAERKIMTLVGRGIDKFYSSSPALIGLLEGDPRGRPAGRAARETRRLPLPTTSRSPLTSPMSTL